MGLVLNPHLVVIYLVPSQGAYGYEIVHEITVIHITPSHERLPHVSCGNPSVFPLVPSCVKDQRDPGRILKSLRRNWKCKAKFATKVCIKEPLPL